MYKFIQSLSFHSLDKMSNIHKALITLVGSFCMGFLAFGAVRFHNQHATTEQKKTFDPYKIIANELNYITLANSKDTVRLIFEYEHNFVVGSTVYIQKQ